jgi:hypothetical protein
MIYNEFESAIRTEGRPDNLCEFMDGVDVTENSCESVSKVSYAVASIPSSAPCNDLYPS